MALSDWLDSDGVFLGPQSPIPLDTPFATASLAECGVSRHRLSVLLDRGLVRRVVRGVYAATQAPDTLRFRAQALRLVTPDRAVITDRTAAWLHGVDILKRGAHLSAPPIELCMPTSSRVRRPEVDGHRRQLLRRDIHLVHGLRVTSPLRTALDLGRTLWRYDALAALDGFLSAGVDLEELLLEVNRFRGFRGVRQLRALSPLADQRAESPAESALRLRWYDAVLPAPDLQIWVRDQFGTDRFRLDLGLAGLRLAAEYDGVAHHSSSADRARDRQRREWLAQEGWLIGVFGSDDVYGTGDDIEHVLRRNFRSALRRYPSWTP